MPTSSDCPRCNGTGIYNGTRRDGSTYEGPCFACQGGGPRFARRRSYAAAGPAIAPTPMVPQANAPVWTARQQASLDAFAAAQPAAMGWLDTNAPTSDFAASLRNGIARYGNLTPRQLACVMRNLDGAERPAIVAPSVATTAPPVERFPAPPVPGALYIRNPAPVAITVDLDRVRSAMESARASGLRKVRLTFGAVTMRLSGPSFRGGAGLILCYHNGGYRGYVDAGNVWHARVGMVADSAALDAFRAVGIDPRAAAATHGHETGNCACCRRLLTDPPSVMAGIGPVCIRRFGWGF